MAVLIIGDYRVLYDDEDYKLIAPYKWYIRTGTIGDPYATANINGKTIGMHRHLLEIPKGKLGDHINHNTLDNRRENLRIVTRSQNMWNRKRTHGTSKYKGVHWDEERKKWMCEIYKNNKKMFKKRFLTEDAAALFYNEKAIELFGEYACLNIISDTPANKTRDGE